MVQVEKPKKIRVQTPAVKESKETLEEENVKETAEEQENTHKWATAVLETRPKKAEAKSDGEKKTNEMSKEEYDKLFHEAAEQTNDEWANKTFEDFQKEDQQQKAAEKRDVEAEATRLLEVQAEEPLSQTIDPSNDVNPEALADLDMVDAMNYTDRATASNKATYDKKAKKKQEEEQKKQE